jgi:hypothetical protein
MRLLKKDLRIVQFVVQGSHLQLILRLAPHVRGPPAARAGSQQLAPQVLASEVKSFASRSLGRDLFVAVVPEAVEGATDDCRSTVWVLLVRALA